MRPAGLGPPGPPPARTAVVPNWTMSRRYSEWVGEIDPRTAANVTQPSPGGEPADVADWILRTLRRMAATAPHGGTRR